MSQSILRRSPQLRVASDHGSVTDADVIIAWHETAAGGEADRIVEGVMVSIAAALFAVDLIEAIPTGADAAIIHGALRGPVVAALRKNLIRRFVAAREEPELLVGKSRRQRIAYLVTGTLGHAL